MQLKQQIAGDVVTLRLARPETDRSLALSLLRTCPWVRALQETRGSVQVYVDQGEEALVKLVQMLEAAQLAVSSVALARPSLDDVFLQQTGHSLRDEPQSAELRLVSHQERKRS
jgi:ABC-2 type transport system ATP-binding protein